MRDIDVKTDEFCAKLINGEIQVSDIPDAFFIPVLKRGIYDLPASMMVAVVDRLNNSVDRLKEEIFQKEELLALTSRELKELEQKCSNIG